MPRMRDCEDVYSKIVSDGVEHQPALGRRCFQVGTTLIVTPGLIFLAFIATHANPVWNRRNAPVATSLARLSPSLGSSLQIAQKASHLRPVASSKGVHSDKVAKPDTAIPPVSSASAAEHLPVVAVARRSAIFGAVGAAMMPFLPSASEAAVVRDCSDLRARGLNVVITGASSGIGLEGARLLYQCGAHVTVLNRSEKRVQDSIDAIQNSGAEGGGTIEGLVCDLTSLRSVNAAADTLIKSGKPIDVLCLNAGVQFSGEKEPRITEDGFETTLQTNHLGHFLLAERLLPELAQSRRQRLASGVDTPSRLVVTASEVHDPTSPGGSVGNVAGLGTLGGIEGRNELASLAGKNSAGAGMVDGKEFDAEKMYKDTKLCNIFFTYELTRRLASADISPRDIAVNAFGPGLITDSGFFRYVNPVFAGAFDFAARNVFRVTETVKGGGTLLANMAANPDYFQGSSGYWNNGLAGFGGHDFTAIPTSAESQDTDKAKRLYDATAGLVGVDAGKAIEMTGQMLRQADARHVGPN